MRSMKWRAVPLNAGSAFFGSESILISSGNRKTITTSDDKDIDSIETSSSSRAVILISFLTIFFAFKLFARFSMRHF